MTADPNLTTALQHLDAANQATEEEDYPRVVTHLLDCVHALLVKIQNDDRRKHDGA